MTWCGHVIYRGDNKKHFVFVLFCFFSVQMTYSTSHNNNNNINYLLFFRHNMESTGQEVSSNLESAERNCAKLKS